MECSVFSSATRLAILSCVWKSVYVFLSRICHYTVQCSAEVSRMLICCQKQALLYLHKSLRWLLSLLGKRHMLCHWEVQCCQCMSRPRHTHQCSNHCSHWRTCRRCMLDTDRQTDRTDRPQVDRWTDAQADFCILMRWPRIWISTALHYTFLQQIIVHMDMHCSASFRRSFQQLVFVFAERKGII